MNKIGTLLFCICLFSLKLAFAASPTEIVQEKLNALHTMKANFSQVVKAKRREISRGTGTMALARPGRFRWQTRQPMAQLLVADGKKLWIYDVDLEQVSVKKQGKSIAGMAALFLSGENNTVGRDFSVTMSEKGHQSSFFLKAKSHQSNFQQVNLVFEGAALMHISLYDQLGQYTDVTLTNVQVNPKLAASLFQFKTPKGVDVVEQ